MIGLGYQHLLPLCSDHMKTKKGTWHMHEWYMSLFFSLSPPWCVDTSSLQEMDHTCAYRRQVESLNPEYVNVGIVEVCTHQWEMPCRMLYTHSLLAEKHQHRHSTKTQPLAFSCWTKNNNCLFQLYRFLSLLTTYLFKCCCRYWCRQNVIQVKAKKYKCE